jgi:hypothetical protein
MFNTLIGIQQRDVIQMCYSTFVFTKEVFQKRKTQNLNDFGGFQSPKWRGKNSENHQISMVNFQCVAKNMKG